ncbi:MAG: nitrate reductase molybdenum cofactor assembly chaperone [Pyrinomonadaceae bacterium]
MLAGDTYEILADLLEYPGSDIKAQIERCAQLASQNNGELLTGITGFREATQTLSLSGLQELYTRTFDLNPVCALEIGYHLFGENYKRGLFLANLRETESPFNIGQEHQLPDYLPVLLRLLTKLDDEELRGSLIGECMIPAIEKMSKALEGGENPYRHLLSIVGAVLTSEVGHYQPTVRRAYLPVLTNDPRNHDGAPEAREIVAPGVSPGIDSQIN